VGERLVTVAGDHDPLAGGEGVVLDDVRRAQLVERRRHLLGRGADPRRRRRHAGRRHHVLRERLRPLELRGRTRRSEARHPCLGERVSDPGHQRRLGSDHDQVGADLPGERRDGCAVHRVHGVQRGERPDPGIAGRGVHLGHLRVARQTQGERVLAATGADHEGPHGRSP
jgi:hypothetical protein